MSINPSVARHPVDADHIFRADGLANVTSDTRSTIFPLDVLGAYWNSGELAMPHDIVAVVYVESLDFTTGDETYDFEVQVDTSATFAGTPKTVATVRATTTGIFPIPVTRELVYKALPAAAYISVNLNVAGTTPIANWWGHFAQAK